jgi:CRP-like cAMP-binding protein
MGQYYVVVEGEVEIRGEGFGADQTVARVGPGQLFGDQGALRGQRGVFTAHAVTRTTLLAVEREAIRDMLLTDDPEST